MAHVKVVRRSMRPEEWTMLRFSWLKRGIYSDLSEITDITIRDARQISENEYEFCDGETRPLRRGDLYFTPDGTAFIRMKARIPERMRGRGVCLKIRTAAEMIVKINGRYAGGIDPNRERIPVEAFAGDGEMDIEIEAYNRSKPDDERNPDALGMRGCRQVFDGAYLCLVRDNVQSLIYDLILLTDMAQSEYFDENLRSFLFAELSRALDLVDFDTWEGVDAAADYVQKHIYENTDYKGTGNVALVAHSHLDIAYYWRRIHAVQKNARTVLIQLRLMDRYPELRYTHTQAYTYETLEKYYPEIFEELKQRVAEGRFEPVGAMYVEPDCNVPAAESLIRQFLYGQHFFRRAFGITVDNAWLPDVFGNSCIMPQILKKCCVDYFVSNKMSTWNDTNRFPHNNFIWKGLDGSRVYACVPPTHFITWNMPSQIRENWEAYQDKDKGGATLSMYGYGDGGSGVTEEMMEMIRRFPKVSAMPKCEVTGGAEFLHKNLGGNSDLAVWDGELYLEMHRGTFTTKSDIKRANRSLEFMLRDTEMACALRMLAGGGTYPAEEIRENYKKLLLNQFHDILPGSHIHPVYEDAMADYREIEKGLSSLLGEDPSLPLFNSLNFDRSLCAFIPSEKGPFTRHGIRGSFERVSAPGLKEAQILPQKGEGDWLKTERVGNSLWITTPVYRAVMAADGSFSSLWDLALSREWVREGHGFNRLHLYADHPGMYDAWDILPNYRDVEYAFSVSSPLHLTAVSPLCAEFEAALATEKSTWTMRIRFFRDSRAIEVEHIADWHEKHRLCKVNFAPEVLTREAVCDTGAGFIRREWTKNTSWQTARFEVCHHKWFDLSETGAGVAVINESKYGLGLEEEVSLSLLRATIRPDIESDMGHHDFCVMILPHEGDAVSAGINLASLEYNVPLRRTGVSFPEPLRSVLCASPLYLQSMKLSEDGRSLVLRLSEQDGRRGRIVFPEKVRVMNMLEDDLGEADALSFHPFEILTVGLTL